MKLTLISVLDGHQDEVLCIKTSSEFNIIIRYSTIISLLSLSRVFMILLMLSISI
jgi:hypothetical protein